MLSQRNLNGQERWVRLSQMEKMETEGMPCPEFQAQSRGPQSGGQSTTVTGMRRP